MHDLKSWRDVPALTREPFLAINAANVRKDQTSKNTSLRAENKTGDWPIPKAAMEAGLNGALVVLFFRHKGKPAEILTGRILSYRKNGEAKNGQNRYRLTIKQKWEPQGTYAGVYHHFFQDFKLGAGTVCAWMSERTVDTPSNPPEPLEGLDVERLVWVRQHHKEFRDKVWQHWDGKCAISGDACDGLLIASHIYPWSKSSGAEKVDVNNGILLSVPLDALFDRGLISFADSGEMLIKKGLSDGTHRQFGLEGNRLNVSNPAKISKEMKSYLKCHRKEHGFMEPPDVSVATAWPFPPTK
jgi:hypothetical protein